MRIDVFDECTQVLEELRTVRKLSIGSVPFYLQRAFRVSRRAASGDLCMGPASGTPESAKNKLNPGYREVIGAGH
jgi:hypothetical protein